MPKTPITTIAGIGKTFAKDFERIDLYCVEDFQNRQADDIFETLAIAKQLDNHKTSKNYLYVIRMIIYYVAGGRDAGKLKWSFWKD